MLHAFACIPKINRLVPFLLALLAPLSHNLPKLVSKSDFGPRSQDLTFRTFSEVCVAEVAIV